MSDTKYSYLKSIIKAIKYPVIVAVGLAINSFTFQFPNIANLTIGGVLILIYDWLKNKAQIRLP